MDAGNITVCGLDLRDGDKPDWNKTGVYSTHLFTSRAEKIITDHAKQSPDKVGTLQIMQNNPQTRWVHYISCKTITRQGGYITYHAKQSPDKAVTFLMQLCPNELEYVCCDIPLRYFASKATNSLYPRLFKYEPKMGS